MSHWPIELNVREALLILVEVYFSLGHVHHVVPLPAILGDTIFLFELVHREDVRDPIWDVLHLEVSVCPHLIGRHRPRVAVDLDASGHSFDLAQVLVHLERRYR